jgi:tellurite resistance protein TerC
VKWYWKWVQRLGLANRPRVRKLIVAVIGSTVVLFGLALIVLPGPAVLVVPLGLALLATEFAWARRLIRRGGVFWGRARRRQWWRRGVASKESLGNDES